MILALISYRLCGLPQAFVDASFESIASTSKALRLLLQFRAIMQRQALRVTGLPNCIAADAVSETEAESMLQEHLETKYSVIFRSFARDLEDAQAQYERQRKAPPQVRDVPLVANNILWARHLLRRIESPMQQCVFVC